MFFILILKKGSIAVPFNWYYTTSSFTFMAGVNCTGNETHIVNCPFNSSSTSSCPTYNDANVICPSKNES